MFQFLFLMIFSNFKLSLFELKSSIASIISHTKEVPEAYLEPCQTSMNKIICEDG